jgi:hypothetical protein
MIIKKNKNNYFLFFILVFCVFISLRYFLSLHNYGSSDFGTYFNFSKMIQIYENTLYNDLFDHKGPLIYFLFFNYGKVFGFSFISAYFLYFVIIFLFFYFFFFKISNLYNLDIKENYLLFFLITNVLLVFDTHVIISLLGYCFIIYGIFFLLKKNKLLQDFKNKIILYSLFILPIFIRLDFILFIFVITLYNFFCYSKKIKIINDLALIITIFFSFFLIFKFYFAYSFYDYFFTNIFYNLQHASRLSKGPYDFFINKIIIFIKTGIFFLIIICIINLNVLIKKIKSNKKHLLISLLLVPSILFYLKTRSYKEHHLLIFIVPFLFSYFHFRPSISNLRSNIVFSFVLLCLVLNIFIYFAEIFRSEKKIIYNFNNIYDIRQGLNLSRSKTIILAASGWYGISLRDTKYKYLSHHLLHDKIIFNNNFIKQKKLYNDIISNPNDFMIIAHAYLVNEDILFKKISDVYLFKEKMLDGTYILYNK